METTYGEDGKAIKTVEYHDGYNIIRQYNSGGKVIKEDRLVTATTSPAEKK